jgi:hypothetical protein
MSRFASHPLGGTGRLTEGSDIQGSIIDSIQVDLIEPLRTKVKRKEREGQGGEAWKCVCCSRTGLHVTGKVFYRL